MYHPRYEFRPQPPALLPSMPLGAIPTAALFAELQRRGKPVVERPGNAALLEQLREIEAQLAQLRARTAAGSGPRRSYWRSLVVAFALPAVARGPMTRHVRTGTAGTIA